jgi:hypothetical protein
MLVIKPLLIAVKPFYARFGNSARKVFIRLIPACCNLTFLYRMSSYIRLVTFHRSPG